MRRGADYRESLKDGRKVWVLGEGAVDDVTAHPATSAMVDYYAAWYDRHHDPRCQEALLMPDGAPAAFVLPRTSDDLVRMGRSYSTSLLEGAGNVTHTPAYGHLIALGVQDMVERRNLSPDAVATARAYRELIDTTGRFLTFSAGGSTIGARFQEDPKDQVPLRVVKEKDGGIVIQGKVSMHTAPAFAEDVYLGNLAPLTWSAYRATAVVPVASPGITVVCRKIAARHANRFVAPLSSRYDELDAQMWLDDVFIPWERIFLTEAPPDQSGPPPLDPERGDQIASWLYWHQLYCWLTKAEFTLGLAFACIDAMGLREHQQTLEFLTDMLIDVQTVRTCITAAEHDPQTTGTGYALPRLVHIAAGSLAMLKTRQEITERLRGMTGSSLPMAPSDVDLADPAMAAGLEASFGGGGYTALQRSALLALVWDHIASGLDGRESAFELYANGGVPVWRTRMRGFFTRYNELANAVLSQLDIEMPELDVAGLGRVAFGARRPAQASPRR